MNEVIGGGVNVMPDSHQKQFTCEEPHSPNSARGKRVRDDPSTQPPLHVNYKTLLIRLSKQHKKQVTIQYIDIHVTNDEIMLKRLIYTETLQ